MSSSPFGVKAGLAEMLKGGVIMDVTNAEQALIAEDSGAVAVMALERIPSDIRSDGGIARMSGYTGNNNTTNNTINSGPRTFYIC